MAQTLLQRSPFSQPNMGRQYISQTCTCMQRFEVDLKAAMDAFALLNESNAGRKFPRGLGHAVFDEVILPDIRRSPRLYPALKWKSTEGLIKLLGRQGANYLRATHPHATVTKTWEAQRLQRSKYHANSICGVQRWNISENRHSPRSLQMARGPAQSPRTPRSTSWRQCPR